MDTTGRLSFLKRNRDCLPAERLAFDCPESGSVTDAWVEVEIGEGWRAAFRLVAFAGKLVIGELRVFPADRYPGRLPATWRAEVLGIKAGPRVRKELPRYASEVDCPAVRSGVTARLLRRIPLGVHIRHATEVIAELSKTSRAYVAEMGLPQVAEKSVPVARRRGSRTSLFYAQLAAAYVARVQAGSRRPVADVAGRRKLANSVVRDAIHTARELRMLTAGRQGAPGGLLTPLAESLLRRGKGKKR